MKLMQVIFTATMALMVSTTIATKHGVDEDTSTQRNFRRSATNVHPKKRKPRRLKTKVGKSSKSSKSSGSVKLPSKSPGSAKLTKMSTSQFTVSYFDNMACDDDGSDSSWDHLPTCGLYSLEPYLKEVMLAKTIDFHPAIPEVPFLGSGRSEHIAARFDGNVNFPVIGLYRARFVCEDGCRFWMFDEDSSEWKLIIDNDDVDQDIYASGASFYISDPGLKQVEVEYYKKSGSNLLTLEIAAPDAPAVPIIFE